MPRFAKVWSSGGAIAIAVTLAACVYRSHSSNRGWQQTSSTARVEERLPPSGDALLDELRRLAIEAPIEDLVAKRLDFINQLYTTYPTDVAAWRGIERLADAALTDPGVPDRRIFARWLAQVIEHADPTVTADFVDKVADLRLVQ